MILSLETLFAFLCLINGVYALYILKNAFFVMREWNPRIIQLNESVEGIDTKDIDSFESDSESTPLIFNIIRKVKSITRKSSDLSVNEIHEVIDDDIMRWEVSLSSSSNNYIMMGVLFTVLSLFSSIPDEPTSKKIEDFLGSFEFAFWTTMIRIVLALVVKFLESLIRKNREEFSYNLVLMVKTILVPSYSIPEVDDKNLGELVLSISKSANSLTKASDSIVGLASKTQAGTEHIEKAVSGFTLISEKMLQREESLNEILGNLNNYLIKIEKNLDETITPLSNNILNQLTNDAIRNESILKEISDFRASQVKINKNISSSLSLISESNNQIGEFFGKDFKNIFKKSLGELHKIYENELNLISKHLKEFSENVLDEIKMDSRFDQLNKKTEESLKLFSDNVLDKINIDSELEKIDKKIESFLKEFLIMMNLIKKIQNPLIEMKSELGMLKGYSVDQNKSIQKTKETIDEINDSFKDVHDSVYKIQDVIEKNSSSVKNDVNDVQTNVKNINESIDNIKFGLNEIVKHTKENGKTNNSGIVDGLKKVFGGRDFKK